MAIGTVANTAFKAYGKAIDQQAAQRKTMEARMPKPEAGKVSDFSETVNDSLVKVNDLQQEKRSMIESFAVGKNQNVHELMIGLQKASLAMNVTSTVRNKMITAYKEVMKMPM
jgi:flagellar hook-basal body complex protein FliE